MQMMSQNFSAWKKILDNLISRRSSVPSLNLDQRKINQIQTIKALCTLQTKEVNKSLIYTRSTEALHTSAKARLTSVSIRIRVRICDPNRHKNLVVCSTVNCQPSLKISCKSSERQTDKRRRLLSSLAEVIMQTNYIFVFNVHV